MSTDYFEKVLFICRDVLGQPNLTPDAGFRKTLGWDSLAHVRILMKVESEFLVSIDQERFAEINSIEKISMHLMQLKADEQQS